MKTMFEINQEEFDEIVDPIYQQLARHRLMGLTSSSHQSRKIFDQLGAEPLFEDLPFTEPGAILCAVRKTAAYRKAALIRANNEIDRTQFEDIVKQLCRQFRVLLSQRAHSE